MQPQLLAAFGAAFTALQPTRLPGFAFSWLEVALTRLICPLSCTLILAHCMLGAFFVLTARTAHIATACLEPRRTFFYCTLLGSRATPLNSQLVSHRMFMPKLLLAKGQRGWPLLQRLLVERRCS